MEFLVRYGEIALKSKPVRKRFEETLVRNIRQALAVAGIAATVKRGYGRITVSGPAEAGEVLARVFGIVSFSPVQRCSASLGEITGLAVEVARATSGTFAVRARRVGTHPFTSQEVNQVVGAAIVALGRKVDLSRPAVTISIEIRDRSAAIWTSTVAGMGGLPFGSQGTVACVICSPEDVAAAWLFMRRGCDLVLCFPGKERGRAVLERWAGKPLPSMPLDAALAHHPGGIVTAQTADMASLKAATHLPVYNPLLGRTPEEVARLLERIGIDEKEQ